MGEEPTTRCSIGSATIHQINMLLNHDFTTRPYYIMDMNDFSIFSNEDWTRDDCLQVMPHPGIIDAFDAEIIFREDPGIGFSAVLESVYPFPDTIAFGLLHARALVMVDKLKAYDRDLSMHLAQLDLLEFPDDLTMSTEQLFVPAHMCSYMNLRLHGSYCWSHMLQLWALSATFSPIFNRNR